MLKTLLLLFVFTLQYAAWAADAPPQPVRSSTEVLNDLKKECDNPKVSNESYFTSYLSKTELNRSKYIGELKAMGDVAVSSVRQELPPAKGEYKQMLVVALAALGDNTAIWQASRLMLKAQLPAVRVCAAHELRKLQDKRLIEPFKQAFSDTFQRMDGSCVNKRMIYPVRLIASSALVKLGIPFEEIQKLST